MYNINKTVRAYEYRTITVDTITNVFLHAVSSLYTDTKQFLAVIFGAELARYLANHGHGRY